MEFEIAVFFIWLSQKLSSAAGELDGLFRVIESTCRCRGGEMAESLSASPWDSNGVSWYTMLFAILDDW